MTDARRGDILRCYVCDYSFYKSYMLHAGTTIYYSLYICKRCDIVHKVETEITRHEWFYNER